MKIIVVSPKNKSVFNFRGDLIRDMIAKGHEVYVVGPNRDYVEDVMALGVKEFIEIPLVKDDTSIGGDLEYLKKLRKVMREVKPDMMFAYTIKPVIYGSIAAKKEGVKKIYPMVTGLGRVYASNSFKTRVVRLITNFLYKRAFKCCDCVMFQNGDDVDDMVRYGCVKREKTAVVNGSGVNMERFKRSPIPEKPVFLMVSRIIREKGVLVFAEAARIVKKQHPEARFIVLGGYDNSIGALKEEDLREYVEDGSIELPGEVKDPVKFFENCSVFVLPSYYREGLPRTILEGLASGRPVVTTDWVGCREAIEDGVNGFLVPIKDAGKLAEKMAILAADRQKVLEMSDAAYKICCEKYEVGVVNRQMRGVMKY